MCKEKCPCSCTSDDGTPFGLKELVFILLVGILAGWVMGDPNNVRPGSDSH